MPTEQQRIANRERNRRYRERRRAEIQWRRRNRDRINERRRQEYRGPAGQARMSANAARRALTLGSPAEDVDRLVVWERDEGICGICGAPADAADWHLDHVTPLACGGVHSYANVQVSHPFCNLSKRDGREVAA